MKNTLKMQSSPINLLLSGLLVVVTFWSAPAANAADSVQKSKAGVSKDTAANRPGQSENPAVQGANVLTDALGLKGSDKGNEGPLTIKSNTVSLDAKDRVFTYRGAVQVNRGDLVINSDLMTGRYDDQNRIQTVTCEDNVVITRGADLRATANRAVYFVPKGIIELTEGPELFRGGNALSADKVRIFVDEDRSDAEGNVQVKVAKSEDATKPKPAASK